MWNGKKYSTFTKGEKVTRNLKILWTTLGWNKQKPGEESFEANGYRQRMTRRDKNQGTCERGKT